MLFLCDCNAGADMQLVMEHAKVWLANVWLANVWLATVLVESLHRVPLMLPFLHRLGGSCAIAM